MYNACILHYLLLGERKGPTMPALQVRDFPEDLYDQLKACAARNHRSVAQQTIAYVEQGMAMESGGECYWDGRGGRGGRDGRGCGGRHWDGWGSQDCWDSWSGRFLHRPARSSMIDFGAERERQERIERRREIFARIHALNEGLSGPKLTAGEVVGLVHECRRERGRQISSSLGLPYDEAI